ncbi:DUF2530 domain-containing protein [Streptomyces sp. SL13]|jgi:hypothetical protein|uniref:DUF2530 domain-containing protein n=1 Tax=Streptantibioticus silvisoli TaxID=2705255 RepID=A0AA90H6B2_9ACTN|nr:DUF2530 domain-containing protein [Streptantibioticus silvisoli]MDI5965182.1 DUF2530 domain-containing protein [Streptantibioticus silvisoli]MDI5969605.1 DUF2530 domain-containing protein [Streptantibioticus silvisoli]
MRTTTWQPRHETPEPLEANDVAITIGGTIIWAVLFVVQLPFYGWYSDHGHAWWIWCCAAGAALGVVGIVYTRRRRDAIRRSHQRESGPAADQG